MTRKLKMLGLMTVSAVAMTCISAPTALGLHSSATFHAEAALIDVGGTGANHALTTDPGTVTCKLMTFDGIHGFMTTPVWTVTPKYEGCTLATIFGNIAVSFNFNGCDYLLNASRHTEIVCPTTGSKEKGNHVQHGPVTISGPGCTITIPAQTIASALSFTNHTEFVKYVRADWAATGIRYSYSGFTCGSGSQTVNGTYSGVSNVFGSTVGGNAVGIWHTPTGSW